MHDLVIRGGLVVDGSGGAPFAADVAIDGRLIVAVGRVPDAGREEIDAAGKIVTPGFVDIHTHYDGQATWDAEMAPSSWHGVTTIVMGNCGVGFAPARPGRHDWLIGLMEGVEDIPGSALAEGIKWEWETFPEYLDALERLPRTIDIGTHVPHGALRAYVLGDRERPGAVPTPDDIEQMAAIVEEAVRAGALGFSTSRTVLHRSVDQELVPGTTATSDELLAIGRAVGRGGYGVIGLASDFRHEWNDFGWMGQISRETGMPVSFTAAQNPHKDLTLDEQLGAMRSENARGAKLVAQIAIRGVGIVMTWQGTMHPFMFKRSWAAIARLPWPERLARLKDPAFRRQLISEPSRLPNSEIFRVITAEWSMQYEMDPGFDYEPGEQDSIAARAARAGVSGDEYAYDLLMREEGTGFIYYPVFNYFDGNLDFLVDLLTADDTVNSLSDGGAHCGTICDAASPTFLLQHWVRERDGQRISIERAIKRQCRDTALLYGMHDRGLVAPGYLADLNIIDMDRIGLGPLWMANDLPANGRRLLQKADGYVATIKSGQVTFRDGIMQGPTPGGVIRGPQPAPEAANA